MLTVKFNRGYYHLSGMLYDAVDALTALRLAGEAQLRLNLRKITAINSVGLMQFSRFIKGWGGRLEFHECSPVMVDAINMFPDLVGGESRSGRIQSVVITYECIPCNRTQQEIVETARVNVLPGKRNVAVTTPVPLCPSCQSAMDYEADPADYFFFMTSRPPG